MTRPPPTIVLALVVMLPGCLVGSFRYGRPLPDGAALSALAPGASRAEVLALLGPADEHRTSVFGEPFRAREPLETRVVEERDLFGRDRLQWTHEVRTERIVSIVPFMPFLTLFRYRRSVSLMDRVAVFFDDAGRVRHVAVRRELPP